MQYVINRNIKRKLSPIGLAPHGIEITSSFNYERFHTEGVNLFHLHGEGGEKVTRKEFAKWMLQLNNRKDIFIVLQVAHKDGEDPSSFVDSRFAFTNLKREIKENLVLLGTNYIDAVYLAEDQENYKVELVQESIAQIIGTGLVNHVGLYNWKAPRIDALQNFSILNNSPGISLIITTELSILKPNFGIWPGYALFDSRMEKIVLKYDLLVLAWTTYFNQSIFKGDKISTSAWQSHETDRWASEENEIKIARINEVCSRYDITPMQLNLSHILNRKFDSILILYENFGPDLKTSLKSLSLDAEIPYI